MIYLEGTIEKFLWSSLRFKEDNLVFQRSFTMDIELVNMFIKVVDFLKDYIKNKYNRIRMWLLRTWPLEKKLKTSIQISAFSSIIYVTQGQLSNLPEPLLLCL